MKQLITILFIAIIMTSCSLENKEQQIALENAQDTIKANRAELIQAIADRDSLFSLINEISEDMDEIKDYERILSTGNLNNESSSQKEKIRNDLQILKNTLQQRQQKLTELQKKLKDSKATNSKLEKTIETLNAQIVEQQKEIETLTIALTSAKGQIIKLESDKDSLNKTISSVTAEKELVEGIAQEAISNVNELNKCFYAIGSKQELKKNKIIESGFLKKTKVLQGDYDTQFFNIGDKRTLNKINLHSKKAKVLTNHPSNSYQIVDRDGVKVLEITNPNAFWNLTNYLVVQVD